MTSRQKSPPSAFFRIARPTNSPSLRMARVSLSPAVAALASGLDHSSVCQQGHHGQIRRAVCALGVGLVLALLQSCASDRNDAQLEAGPGAELSSSEVATYARNQSATLDASREAAGEPAAIINWDASINAGSSKVATR